MTITPEVYDESLANLLQKLRDAAADHSAHAERLEALIRHYSASPSYRPEDAPLDAAKGLSARVANMLDDDVSHLYWWREHPELRQRQPLQYPAYMIRVRRLAADRRRREEHNLLNIDLSDPTKEK